MCIRDSYIRYKIYVYIQGNLFFYPTESLYISLNLYVFICIQKRKEIEKLHFKCIHTPDDTWKLPTTLHNKSSYNQIIQLVRNKHSIVHLLDDMSFFKYGTFNQHYINNSKMFSDMFTFLHFKPCVFCSTSCITKRTYRICIHFYNKRRY